MRQTQPHLPPYEVRKVPLVTAEIKKLSNWAFRSFRIKELWKHTKGERVRVGLLDTGPAPGDHKDIKVKKFVNFTDDKDEDKSGHGIWTGGSIRAANGFLGIAPEAELYVAKILRNDGSGDWDWLRRGLEWALQEECQIVNVSAGGDYSGKEIQPVLKKMADLGIVVCCAAGNERDLLIFPANSEHTLAVGAVDKKWHRAKFSNFGPRLITMAPGVELLGCWLDNGYSRASGTSMATPIVSGILTLESAKHRLNLTEAITRLAWTSKDIGKPGWEPDTGWGVIAPHKFLMVEAVEKKLTWAWIINMIMFLAFYFFGGEEHRVE